jgi:16S rRNA (guanine966-N2)-methyltransferase
MRGKSGARQVRIIGGEWRGRKLSFPDLPQLRPSPDRVRETLFNWLQPVIPGARCLDLYAGSGALGMEALSRGAQSVTLVDLDSRVIRSLQQNLDTMIAGDRPERARVVQQNVLEFLQGPARPVDVVFLDPPYGKGLVSECCALLETRGWLRDNARVYIEAEATLEVLDLPQTWEMLRSKTAGQVGYHLAGRKAKIPIGTIA